MKRKNKLSLIQILTHKKSYYIPGFDEFNQLVETPASKEITDTRRFIITTAISIIAAIAAIVAAIASLC